MKIAIVEWWPRICGAVTWALHLSHARPPRGGSVDRLTFSASGRPLAAWDRADLWQVHRIRDAVEVLNAYDLVILSDVVCCAPAMTKSPYYIEVLNQLKVPWTSMCHDGAYHSKHDETFRAVLGTPTFTGSLLTTRLREARARVDHLSPRPLRWVRHPYLPYAISPFPAIATPLTQRPRNAVLMTSRIAVNKGQNVALYLSPRAEVDVHLYGYNAFGLPSIGWRLWELAEALGYRTTVPKLRHENRHLTHPRANRFYSGRFVARSRGWATRYHDGFATLADVGWEKAAYHLSLSNTSVRGTLEYVTLEAIAAGAVAIVPEHAVEYARYAPGSMITVPYTRAVIWAKKDGTPQVKLDPAEEAGTLAVLRQLATASGAKLERVAAAQHRELVTKHDPTTVLRKLIGGVR